MQLIAPSMAYDRQIQAYRREFLASGDSLDGCSSLRRFEQTGDISFSGLVALAYALNCQSDLEQLFAAPAYRSIQEVIDETR